MSWCKREDSRRTRDGLLRRICNRHNNRLWEKTKTAIEISSDPTPDMPVMPHLDDGAIDMQELLRRLAEQVVNAIMDAEADQLCAGGANSRNGYRERELKTCMGDITLLIPKLVFSQA